MLAVVTVLFGGLATFLCGVMFDIQPGARLGLFSGATTNTPSLGAAQQAMLSAGVGADQMALPVLAYSASYPVGIVGVIATLLLLKRFFKIDLAAENREFEAHSTSESSR